MFKRLLGRRAEQTRGHPLEWSSIKIDANTDKGWFRIVSTSSGTFDASYEEHGAGMTQWLEEFGSLDQAKRACERYRRRMGL